MTPTKDKQAERIDKLEDERLEKLCDQVDSIHKILIGNGSDGIIQKVSKNTAKIKLMAWLVSLITTFVFASYFGKEAIEKAFNSTDNAVAQTEEAIE